MKLNEGNLKAGVKFTAGAEVFKVMEVDIKNCKVINTTTNNNAFEIETKYLYGYYIVPNPKRNLPKDVI